MKRVVVFLAHHICQHCDGWIWRPTHPYAHTSCAHKHRLGLWVRGRDEFGYDVPFQPCVDCGLPL